MCFLPLPKLHYTMLTRNALSVTGFLATVLSAAAAFEPPLPWTQHPEATATILEVPEETSMSLLSEEEQAIFTISPKRQWGSTSTGSIFLSQYQNSSSVAYNELIVVSFGGGGGGMLAHTA